MKFNTTRFGEIDISPEQIFLFPEGLLGFSSCTKFAFIDEEGSEPFKMMQSLDMPSLAFVIVDPLVSKPDFFFQVTKSDLSFIKAEQVEGLVVYAIVTMAESLKNATLNLQGPLIINPENRLGHQFILMNEPYTTKEPLMSDALIREAHNIEAKKQQEKQKATG